MQKHLTAMLAAGMLFAGGGLAVARDSFSAQYDINKPAHIVGTVTTVDWTTPRSFLTLEGRGANGKLAEFRIELGNRRELEHKGWRPDTIRQGQTVAVKGWYARDDRNRIRARALKYLGREYRGLTFSEATASR
jgi:hypothetical protein